MADLLEWMLVGVSSGHTHNHLHNTRGHDESCTCRSCRYDGSVNDLLTLRNAVDRITKGGGEDDKREGESDDPMRRKLDRMSDEYTNYAYHRGGVDIYV